MWQTIDRPPAPALVAGAAQPNTTSRAVITGVAKAFGPTRALIDANLEIRAGEVHTVMGENGSGKSTLVKVLSGVHRPDQGSFVFDGVATDWLSTPARARAVGISTVFQEVLTVPGRTILENVWLGAKRGEPIQAERRARAEQILESLLGAQVDVDRPVDALSLSERQTCCIARSVLAEPSLLILDESTASLDVATRDRLFDLIRRRSAAGVSVLFISHRMNEVFDISDVVTVFRAGTTVASRLPMSETSATQLVEMMSEVGERPKRHRTRSPGEVVLKAQGVQLADDRTPIELEIRAGELVALAGLEGQGQDLFINVLRGIRPAAGGQVLRCDESGAHTLESRRDAHRRGIAYVPRERRREGVFEQLAVYENFGLPRLHHDAVGPLVVRRRTVARFAMFKERLRVKLRTSADPISSLSGGNQQKVVVARALADDPRVLLLNDPTRGIDPGAKHDLYELLLDLCTAGLAVVMLSSEVDELVDLADRVVVFRDNEISAHLSADELTPASLVSAYFGERAAVDTSRVTEASVP